MAAFTRYIGIDYSGAQTPSSSLKGLRVYLAEGEAPPLEVLPPPSPRKYWSRRGLAEWLVQRLAEDAPTLVGIDHGFSFPLRYFEAHGLAPNWPAFLDDFQRHWPTDEDIYVEFVRDGTVGDGAARQGNARWRRLTELRAGGAKSVFHFDVQGSVAKSSHSGIPWLRFIRRQIGPRVHFWPFDGWDITAGRSAIAEVYPALWSRAFAHDGRTGDQHDAFSIAAWLSRADRDGSLKDLLHPDLTPPERTVAEVEGWILGVAGLNQGEDKRTNVTGAPTGHQISAETLKAYLETDYCVAPGSETPGLAMRVGEPCEALRKLYAQGQTMQAVFITACNPLGIATAEDENQAAQAALASKLSSHAFKVLSGEGRGRLGDWPAEPSWFALGVDFDTACRLGREFRQNAIIWVGSDLSPALVVLRGGGD